MALPLLLYDSDTLGHHDWSAKWEHGCQSLDINLSVFRGDGQHESGNVRWEGGQSVPRWWRESLSDLCASQHQSDSHSPAHSHLHRPSESQWSKVAVSAIQHNMIRHKICRALGLMDCFERWYQIMHYLKILFKMSIRGKTVRSSIKLAEMAKDTFTHI